LNIGNYKSENVNFAQVKIQDKQFKKQVVMINHIVLFRLKEYSEDEKPLVIAEMKSLLEGLKGKIDELKYIEVDVNYELNTKNYDLVLISHFNSIEDLDKYRIHPEHKKVLSRFSELRLERAAVDFEF
jgi:deoxyribodipyrimidine photolyase-like uncharacterized protein